MRRYLVTLSMSHDSDAIIPRALRDCVADGAELEVVYISRPAGRMKLPRHLTEQSFLGPGPSREAADQIKQTMLKHALARLEDIELQAEAADVPCRIDVIEGIFNKQAVQIAEIRRANRLYVAGKASGPLARLLFKSPVDQVVKDEPCRVVVVDDSESLA